MPLEIVPQLPCPLTTELRVEDVFTLLSPYLRRLPIAQHIVETPSRIHSVGLIGLTKVMIDDQRTIPP